MKQAIQNTQILYDHDTSKSAEALSVQADECTSEWMGGPLNSHTKYSKGWRSQIICTTPQISVMDYCTLFSVMSLLIVNVDS